MMLAQMPDAVKSVWTFFSTGGMFMWPLLACSVVAVTVMILRGMALRRKNVLPLVIESEIERLVPGGSAERLARIVQQDESASAGSCAPRCIICARRATRRSRWWKRKRATR